MCVCVCDTQSIHQCSWLYTTDHLWLVVRNDVLSITHSHSDVFVTNYLFLDRKVLCYLFSSNKWSWTILIPFKLWCSYKKRKEQWPFFFIRNKNKSFCHTSARHGGYAFVPLSSVTIYWNSILNTDFTVTLWAFVWLYELYWDSISTKFIQTCCFSRTFTETMPKIVSV